jgi:hypothetical protein
MQGANGAPVDWPVFVASFNEAHIGMVQGADFRPHPRRGWFEKRSQPFLFLLEREVLTGTAPGRVSPQHALPGRRGYEQTS